MSIFNLGCLFTGALALWGMWLGTKVLMRTWSYRSSRHASPRFNMRDTDMRVKLENCPGEYGILDMSQSGMAIYIDHFVDGFSLAKRTKFILRNNNGDVASLLIRGKVVYLKQLSHGYRLGVQFDFPIEANIVEAFRSSVEQLKDESEITQLAA